MIAFGTDAVAGVQYTQGGTLVGADGVVFWLEETAVAGQAQAKAKNLNGTSTRTIDWVVKCFTA